MLLPPSMKRPDPRLRNVAQTTEKVTNVKQKTESRRIAGQMIAGQMIAGLDWVDLGWVGRDRAASVGP